MVEKIVTMKQKYKQIKDKVEEIVQYKCSDGRILDSKEDALKWESILLYKKKFTEIEKLNTDSVSDIGLKIDYWYRPKNEEQLEMLKVHFNVGKYYVRMCTSTGDMQIGNWYGEEPEYDSDGDAARYYIHDLQSLKEEVSKYLALFEERENE